MQLWDRGVIVLRPVFAIRVSERVSTLPTFRQYSPEQCPWWVGLAISAPSENFEQERKIKLTREWIALRLEAITSLAPNAITYKTSRSL